MPWKEVNQNMYNHYYLNNNQQPSYAGGNYELHKSTCPYYYNFKSGDNFSYVGYYFNEYDALNASKQKFPLKSFNIDGCSYCCPSIHKK